MPDNNPLKDIQNILGFLLAGFAGVLGFLGLRSTEVSTVLRNDSLKASLIAFILLLAVLTAVVSVAVPHYKKVPLPRVVAIFLLLLGVGALVIFAIPIGSSYWAAHGVVSLVVSALLVVIAIALYVRNIISVRKERRQRGRLIPMQLTFIVVGVMLIATSVYGAMRLEADSQLTSAVQISANIAKKASDMALSVRVGGAKFRTTGYVGVLVQGLPGWIPITSESECGNDLQCAEDPCHSHLHHRSLVQQCEFIFGAVFPPDASGNINETMSDALVLGLYQDISVSAVPCGSRTNCNFDPKTPGSHLDIRLPTT